MVQWKWRQNAGTLLKVAGIVTVVLLAIMGIAIAVQVIQENSERQVTIHPLVNASDVWEDYKVNETRANQDYKNQWFRVRMDKIDEIESGGKVLMHMSASGISRIEFDFRDDTEVRRLNPGRGITAICQLRGFQLDTWLQFKDCRFP